MLLERQFDPAAQNWPQFMREQYRDSLAETVRLARTAVDAGFHIHMYPERTVSQRLGPGRPGAVQFALTLGLPIVPIGMSGCPQSFFADSPMARPGHVHIRVGETMTVPAELVPPDFMPFDPEHEQLHKSSLQGFTDGLMDRIETLIDEPHPRIPGEKWQGKGTKAFL